MKSRRDLLALSVAELIQNAPDFDYSSLFAPEMERFYPKNRLVSIFTKMFFEHGSFKKLSKLHESNEVTHFRIEYQSGFSDLILGLNDQGIINKFFLGGFKPDDTLVSVEDLKMPTRDGAELRTLVFQKNDGFPKPVILERSPYLHFIHGETPLALLYANVARQFVEDGYAFVLQAVRGTGGSTGTFKFLNPQEIEDGKDAVEWSAKQSFSVGSVGLLGGSYDGFTAMAAAVSNPEALKVVVASSYFTNMSDFGGLKGVVELFQLRWLDRVTRSQGTPMHLAPFSAEQVAKIQDVLDLSIYDQLIYGCTIPEWQELARASLDVDLPYWKERSIFERLGEIKTPTFHLAGMNGDGNAIDTLKGFQTIQKDKGYHHLILGPWGHPATPQIYPAIQAMAHKWFSHYLKGEPLTSEPLVTIVSDSEAAANNFKNDKEYPLSCWKKMCLYLKGTELSDLAPEEENAYVLSSRGNASSDDLVNDKEISESSEEARKFSVTFKAPTRFVGAPAISICVNVISSEAHLVGILRKKSGDDIKNLGMVALKLKKTSKTQSRILDFGPQSILLSAGDELELLLSTNAFPILASNNRVNERSEIQIISSKEFPSQISFGVDS